MTIAQVTRPVAESPPESISNKFIQVAASEANRIAISSPCFKWTYAGLDERSTGIARRLLRSAARAGEPVALLMDHDAPLIAAILGTLKAGRIYLALDPAEPRAALEAMLADSAAAVLVADPSNLTLARALGGSGIEVIEMDEHTCGDVGGGPLPGVSPAAGAWLMYTSGSTGRPKGVWQNHAGVVHHAAVFAGLARITPGDRMSLLTSCNLAASATALFTALLNGATLCPFHLRSRGVEQLAQWLQEQGITVYHSVPTVFRRLMATLPNGVRIETLRLVRLGGEPVFRADFESFKAHCSAGCELMHALSSTETGLISALFLNANSACPWTRIPAGHPVRGLDVLLLDNAHEPVAEGQEGRIAVRSVYLAQGYWRRPGATAESYRPDPLDGSKRLFISADLGRLGTDSGLEHLGRVDQQVKIRGRRVDLAEVEAALRATGLCSDAVAIARESGNGERHVVAYVVPLTGAELSPPMLRRALQQLVPEAMVPSGFVALPRLPQTPGGKVDRTALHAMEAPQIRRAVSRLAPRDAIEVKVARIWESVLNVPAVGRDEDFFELGGTSIESAQVLARIDQQFSVDLPPSALAERSTVEALAALLADQTISRSSRPLLLMRTAARGVPLFFIHNGKGDVSTYGQLVRRLSDRPIYGLQALGLNGEGWPLMSVPAMAGRYLEEVTAACPTGPYLLAGTCIGGFVAFEMARELSRQGRPVALIAILGSPAAPGFDRRNVFERVMFEVRDAFRIARWTLLRAAGVTRRGASLAAYRRFVTHMNVRSRRWYQPGFLEGTLTLITAADKLSTVQNPQLLMSIHARTIRHIAMSCDRNEMFAAPAVDELARHLQGCVEEAV